MGHLNRGRVFNLKFTQLHRAQNPSCFRGAQTVSTRQLGQPRSSYTVLVLQYSLWCFSLADLIVGVQTAARARLCSLLFRYSQTEQNKGALARDDKPRAKTIPVNRREHDLISWEFIYYMLGRLGFCGKWIGWIKNRLESSSIFVLVNGSSTTEFKPIKGLRQGDVSWLGEKPFMTLFKNWIKILNHSRTHEVHKRTQQELKLPIETQQRTKPTNWNSRIQYRNGFLWKMKQEQHVQRKGT